MKSCCLHERASNTKNAEIICTVSFLNYGVDSIYMFPILDCSDIFIRNSTCLLETTKWETTKGQGKLLGVMTMLPFPRRIVTVLQSQHIYMLYS